MIKFLFKTFILIIVVLAILFITNKDKARKKIKEIAKATHKFIDKNL